MWLDTLWIAWCLSCSLAHDHGNGCSFFLVFLSPLSHLPSLLVSFARVAASVLFLRLEDKHSLVCVVLEVDVARFQNRFGSVKF